MCWEEFSAFRSADMANKASLAWRIHFAERKIVHKPRLDVCQSQGNFAENYSH